VNVFGPKRDEVTGDWMKLHNESFTICVIKYYLGDKSKRRAQHMTGEVQCMHVFGLET
jgi:hypothetical protein